MKDLLFPRLLRPQKGSFFLFGPRGCGKSTWLARNYPEARTVDLLDEARYQSYLAEPGLFFEGLADLPSGSWVSVDEIQRLPQLLNEVHRLIEQRRLKFVLTGSSARKLRRTGVNLLGGRALRQADGTTFADRVGDDHNLRLGRLPSRSAPTKRTPGFPLFMKSGSTGSP